MCVAYRTRSLAARAAGAATLLALAGPGCAPALRPAETYEWAGRAIAFSLPPADWRREGYNEGGWLGAYFVHEHSVGERILVAEQYVMGRRDGRQALRELLERFDTYDSLDLRRALVLSRYRTDDPLSPRESEVAARVNESLGRAMLAHINGDREAVRRELGGAAREAEQLELSLGDVIERVEFRPEKRQEPARWRVLRRREGQVAGHPAVFVDYLFLGPERTLACRDVYVMHDNHLFTASFLGLERNRAIFDRVVASIHWPEPANAGQRPGRSR